MGPLEIILAIVGISILVIVHESGHYLVARAFGMRVLTYSIGFGPTIFKYQPKDSPTVFKVAAIPFLAYVQIAGMNPQEDVDEDDPEIFPNKSLFARAMTIVAGPAANYLAAVVIAFFIGLVGWPSWVETILAEPVVAHEVQEDGAAYAGGLRAGDAIVSVGGDEVSTFATLIEATQSRANEATEYVVLRDSERLSLTVTPTERLNAEGQRIVFNGTGEPVGFIGVAAPPPAPYALDKALATAFAYPIKLTALQLSGMADMVEKRSTAGLGGPVAMGKMVGSAAQAGAAPFFAVLVLLSVALGMFNLLPFPALDGGRLMFLIFEAVTRRRPNEQLEAAVHTVGIVFLLCVIALVTVRDIFGEGPEAQGARQLRVEESAEAAAEEGDAGDADAQPADVQPADAQLADAEPADVQPADVQPADLEPSAGTPSE
ncbi:MAG: M50 family metallopeptidase [Myxococcota bacterium]